MAPTRDWLREGQYVRSFPAGGQIFRDGGLLQVREGGPVYQNNCRVVVKAIEDEVVLDPVKTHL
jgi:hypothetical protein